LGNNAFQGVQPSLNNAIGANNVIAQGGLAGPIGSYNTNLMNQVQSGMPSSVGSPGGGPDALSQMNPYLKQYYDAAALPLTQTYQNATMPNIVGNAAQTGTVGGSGQNQATNLANNQLAQCLGNLAAGIYEPAFAQAQSLSAQEQMQNQALSTQSAQQAQQLGAQELMQGRGIGANLFGQGLGMTQNAIGMAPSLAAGAYIPANQMIKSGQTAQNQLQQILDSAYGNLGIQSQWPQQQLNQFGQGLSTVGGLGQGTQTQTGPSQGGFK
jgi:hypothetical protein